MANTYVAIATVTVGSGGAAEIEFTSIPQTYTDLVIVYSARDNQSGSTGNDNGIKFNGSSSNFSGRRLLGSGSSVSSDTVAPYAGSSTSEGVTASTFCNNTIYIPNYTGSTNKSYSVDSVTENNATIAYQILYAGLWSQTAAITSVTIVRPSTFNFVQHSTATLYGIKNS